MKNNEPNTAAGIPSPARKKFRIHYSHVIMGLAAFAYFFALQTDQTLAARYVVESGGHYEGCIRKNPRHLHHCSHRDRIGSITFNEFQQVRQDRGRVPCMAQAHCYLMGHPKRSGLYPRLCYTLLCRREMDGLMGRRNDSWVFLTASWNGLPSR